MTEPHCKQHAPYYVPAPNRRGHKAMMLSDVYLTSVCLSRTSSLSRKESLLGRPRSDSDTTFKVKRSKVKVTRPLCSPPCWRVRRLQRWTWECVGRGNCCYVAVCSAAQGGRGEGPGHIVAAAHLQLVISKEINQHTNCAWR